MTRSCYVEKQNNFYRNHHANLRDIDYEEYKRRRIARQRYLKKQQEQALRRFIFLSTVLVILLFTIFKVFYRCVYLPIQNSSLQITIDKNFYRSADRVLTNVSFLGYKHVLDTPALNNINSLMKPVPLGTEILGLKNMLLPIVNSDVNYKSGIFIWDNKTNNYVAINADQPFSTASIIKIPVLIEMFRQIDKGLLSINELVEFNTLHLAEGSGELQYSPVDKYHTLDYLAKIMIEHSDNSATNIILDQIGGARELNWAISSWGLKNTHMENWLPDLSGTNIASPRDFATMLYNINNPWFLSPQSSNQIKQYMANIKNRHLINSAMPADATIIHKTGDIGTMVGDAGVITLKDGRQIIIIAMVERPWNSYKAKDIIREVSRVALNYFSNDGQLLTQSNIVQNQ